MSKLVEDIKYFWSKKCFAVGLPLVMVLSYATLLLHPTVGIDDTSFKLYYIDGVSPAMGRWCLYMIQKILPLDYNPYFVEAVGLLCFCVSVSLWCVVFYRLLGERVSLLGYTVFAGVMISSPMLSEVVVWYLQDGVYLGYGFTALAVLAGMRVFDGNRGKTLRRRMGGCFVCAVFLTVALGFYEAFMIVFLMGMAMNLLLVRALGRGDYEKRIGVWLGTILITCVISMGMRSLVINGITVFFHLEEQALVLENRGLGDILALFRGWFDGSRSLDDFVLVLKEFFVKYYLHAVVYLPVMVLVLAVGVVFLWGGYRAVRARDGWIGGVVLGILLLPWIMPVLEGTATYYRSSEYVPLLTAFAVLLVALEVRQSKKRWLRPVSILLAGILLYRQGYEMNRWLLVDAMKYEDDKRTLEALALELMAEYDTGKPVCVVGNRRTPESLLSEVYTPVWSKKYVLVKALVNAVDERIFEKYDTPQGYGAAETPQLSFINWANKAFYGFDRELVRFWEMHGFSFTEDGIPAHYEQAREMMRDAPAWPREGSIVEMEDYIIVNFGNYGE